MVFVSEDCKKLGVMENMCGKCTALKGGGFQLEETKAGLRSVCEEREKQTQRQTDRQIER